jgi:hypothetical protein
MSSRSCEQPPSRAWLLEPPPRRGQVAAPALLLALAAVAQFFH